MTNKQELREELSNPAIGNKDHLRKIALALLDELEAVKRANAAQDDHINQQQNRIDQLEKGHSEAAKQINSWRKLAKQNIAEREKDLSELDIARKRIAELEASHGNLREAMAGIHNTITGGGAYTPMAAILNASKRAYEESAIADGRINGEG